MCGGWGQWETEGGAQVVIRVVCTDGQEGGWGPLPYRAGMFSWSCLINILKVNLLELWVEFHKVQVSVFNVNGSSHQISLKVFHSFPLWPIIFPLC